MIGYGVIGAVALVTYVVRSQLEAARAVMKSISDVESVVKRYTELHHQAIGTATQHILISGSGVEHDLLEIARVINEKQLIMSEISAFKGIALLHPGARREVEEMINIFAREAESEADTWPWIDEIEKRLARIGGHFSKRLTKSARMFAIRCHG